MFLFSCLAKAWRKNGVSPLPVTLVTLLLATSAAAQFSPNALPPSEGTYLPAVGGSGGSQFKVPCAAGMQLAGFELRAGDDIDAVRPVCVTAAINGDGKHVVGPAELTQGTGIVCTSDDLFCDTRAAGQSLNPSQFAVAPGWYGGIGGHIERVFCPEDAPIVLGMDVRAEGVNTITVNNIHLFCGWFDNSTGAGPNPSNIFDAPGNDDAQVKQGSLRCPAGQVAIGAHGRAGRWLDALGLICGAPRVKTYRALGRIETGTPAPATPSTICAAAKSARARNSPAAPGLERQCAAQSPPPLQLGRAAPADPNAPAMSLCDAARGARQRNSPAAPGLERQCLAGGGFIDDEATNALAATGASIAAQDADVAKARGADADVLFGRGFDIASGLFGDPALGAAGNTLMGPGSLKIRNVLSQAGQRGFDASVRFHLARNYQH